MTKTAPRTCPVCGTDWRAQVNTSRGEATHRVTRCPDCTRARDRRQYGLLPHQLTIPGMWITNAACTPETAADWELETERAVTICQGCPVRQQCLEWAVANQEPIGVWGGLTAAERHRKAS